MQPNTDGVNIEIECFDTSGIPHKKKRPLSKSARAIAKKDLLITKPTKYKQKKADKLLNDSGGSCPLLHNTQVFCSARQEAKDEVLEVKRYQGDPITSIMAMTEDMVCIREISTYPFYILYWTENQITLWREAHEVLKSSVSIDASGCFVKAVKLFDDNKSSEIFLYNAVIRINKKIYTLTQALSGIHDTNFIFLWLFSWLRSGAPVPPQVVVDCSGALLNAISLAFNHMYYDDYLQRCFVILNDENINDKNIKLPQSLIKRDRAHLIKAMCKWKCFEGDNWIKKDFLIRCIAYSLEVDNIQLLIKVVTAIFIVIESKFCDKNTECFKKKMWLIDAIATFDYDKYYKDEHDQKEELQKDYSYMNQELESPDVEMISNFIYNIYNECLPVCSIEEKNCSDPNNYYLPSARQNLLALYSQFPAWSI